MTSIFDRLKKVIVEQLDVEEEQVAPEVSFADDLDADSLDLIELITAIEEEFSSPGWKVEIADEDIEKIQTVQDAVDYLYSHGIAD